MPRAAGYLFRSGTPMIWRHEYSQLDAVPLTWAECERTITETKNWPGGPPNILPTKHELKTVSAFLVDELSELESLELQLQRLQEVYVKIELERNELSRAINAHRVYISPIRRIPDDIVREIMLRCLPSDPHPSHMNRHTAPVLLTHICRRWRSIAHSTPRLWSSLHVSFRCLMSDLYRRRSEERIRSILLALWEEDTNTMRWWLAMAGACSLQISFRDIPEPDHDKIIPCVDDFLDFLLTTTHQWESIDLMSARGLPYLFRDKITSQNLALLSAIRIGVTPRHLRTATTLQSKVLHSTNLRQLTFDIDRGSLSIPADLPAHSWSRLTVLTLVFRYHTDIDDGIRVLAMCGRIEMIVLEYRPVQDWSIGPEGQCTEIRKSFPHLHSLALDIPLDYISRTLRVIAAPVLEDLSILTACTDTIIPDFFADELQEFFQQSSLARSSRMQALRLDPIHYSRSTFYQVLEMFPAITSLSLTTEWSESLQSLRHANLVRDDYRAVGQDGTLKRASNIDDEFLQRLAILPTSSDNALDASHRPLLPCLEEFTCLARTQFSLSALQQFLHAKRQPLSSKGIARLRRFELLDARHGHLCESIMLVKADVLEALKPFEEDGLVLEMKTVLQIQKWC